MKKSLRKKIFPLCLAVSALSLASLFTSCGNDGTSGDDVPALAEVTTSAEITTTATDISETTAEIQTTTTETQIPSVNVPTGTQAEIIEPPVTEYTEATYPEYTETTVTEAVTEDDTPQYTVTTNISSYVGNSLSASPNSSFYQEKISVAGDSIAFGFNLYGLIPAEHNIATESLSMWNLDYFTFSTGMGLVDTINYYQPTLLYMSLGMNDVNASTAEVFAERYQNVINQVLSLVPNVNIVVAGITPVTSYSNFTSNQTIMDFNSALKNMVSGLNSSQVYYFDAFSVLADPATNSLRPECTGGDGIHLTTQCYYDIFNELFRFLDTTNVKKQVEQAEASRGYTASY